VELAGEQAGGEGGSRGDGRQPLAISADGPPNADLPANETPGHVRLQPDAKFPLRYRELVGEYFRVMAESGKEGEK
jgi:hypothetical protein